MLCFSSSLIRILQVPVSMKSDCCCFVPDAHPLFIVPRFRCFCSRNLLTLGGIGFCFVKENLERQLEVCNPSVVVKTHLGLPTGSSRGILLQKLLPPNEYDLVKVSLRICCNGSCDLLFRNLESRSKCMWAETLKTAQIQCLQR